MDIEACGKCSKEAKALLQSKACRRRLIYCWFTCAEEGLQAKEAKGWKDGLSLARSICDYCCLGKGLLLPQREGRRSGA